MQRFLPLTVAAGVLAATASSYAGTASPEPTITFSRLNAMVSATAAPAGPLAVWLSILAIAAVLAYASRKGTKHVLSLPVAASQPLAMH